MAVPSIEQILAQGGGNPVVIDGVMYQPIFDSTGQGETFEQGPLTQVVAYKPGETATGQAYKTYSPDMQEIGKGEFKDVGNIGDLLKTAGEDLAPLAAMALTMGGAGGLLGSALTGGSLTGTAASALGNALISGGAGALTGQDPLKAALLAAGSTYAGSLFGGADAATKATDAQNIAEYAQELAAQGLPSTEIERILKLNGVNPNAAGNAALSVTDGTPFNQIVSDLTNYTKGSLFTGATSAVSPATVTTDPLTGLQTATATGSLASPVVNAGGLLSGLTTASQSPTVGLDWFADQPITKTGTAEQESSPIVNTTVTPDLNQQVTISGDKAPTFNLGDILATIDPSLIGPGVGPQPPSEQVVVSGTAQPKAAADDLAAAIAATVNPATVTTPPTNQVIDVTGTAQPQKNIGDVAAAINAGTLYGPGMTGTQTTVYDKTLEATDSKTAADTAATLAGGLTLADLLKAFTTLSSLGMLGGGGGGGGGGTTLMAPTTPVPVGNADYYKAIQQYYNTYMPQTPRDVATPLQQWYEGKFGG